MKKLEQSILLILIVTCIGMCFGSILIAFQRNKDNTTKPDTQVNQIFFRPSEENQINAILKDQVYPALMHHQTFPSSLFSSTSTLLSTEEDRFYFVFEMMRTSMNGSVLCADMEEGILTNQCRILASDFQKQSMKIFGRRINMNLILKESVYQVGEYIYTDYISSFTPSFVLRFSSLQEQNGTYELVLDFYTSIENGSINYRNVSSWDLSTLISQKFLYGKLTFTYQLQNNEKIITAVSFQKL